MSAAPGDRRVCGRPGKRRKRGNQLVEPPDRDDGQAQSEHRVPTTQHLDMRVRGQSVKNEDSGYEGDAHEDLQN
ncbi:MAG: hypothetical protein QOI08_2571 [Actinomycetota bacterium]|nr:hypothetical protein [Actinomycetota bacterium]